MPKFLPRAPTPGEKFITTVDLYISVTHPVSFFYFSLLFCLSGPINRQPFIRGRRRPLFLTRRNCCQTCLVEILIFRSRSFTVPPRHFFAFFKGFDLYSQMSTLKYLLIKSNYILYYIQFLNFSHWRKTKLLRIFLTKIKIAITFPQSCKLKVFPETSFSRKIVLRNFSMDDKLIVINKTKKRIVHIDCVKI